jgi:hypothetical protein
MHTNCFISLHVWMHPSHTTHYTTHTHTHITEGVYSKIMARKLTREAHLREKKETAYKAWVFEYNMKWQSLVKVGE